jgi:hypothetical protein
MSGVESVMALVRHGAESEIIGRARASGCYLVRMLTYRNGHRPLDAYSGRRDGACSAGPLRRLRAAPA